MGVGTRRSERTGQRLRGQTNRLRPDDDPAKFSTTMEWIDAQSGERMLEVGCGNGAVARAAARHAPAIRGMVALGALAARLAKLSAAAPAAGSPSA